jgi:hypothetical protein
LVGHTVSDVLGSSIFELVFDAAAEGRLSLAGPFRLGTGAERGELFEPPCPGWVGDLLLSLLGVRIDFARYNRSGWLRVVFGDGRFLETEDGPFENWHYADASGLRLHGGVGRVA